MTVQNLYTKYLDGEISKQKFLYEVRRDSNLTMISPSNSFEDVVKILKNKSIISEKASKESKGKQEVEIIAKTIDMVNPYEYTKGMEYELNITDVPATSGDLSEENVAKAQKKVLTNLTKNPRYYTEKMCGKGEVSEEWVEATKKEIEKIGKGKKDVIREGIHDQDITSASHTNVKGEMGDYDPAKRAARLNKLQNFGPKEGDVTAREIAQALIPIASKGEISQYFQSLSKAGDKFDTVDDYVEDFKNYIADKSLEETNRPGYHPDGTPKSNDEMSDDEREEFYNDSNFLDEHGQYADRVADVNADSSPLREKTEDKFIVKFSKNNNTYQVWRGEEIITDFNTKERADSYAKFKNLFYDLEEGIYKKYADKWDKTLDEVKDMVKEAIALKDKAGNTQYAKDSTEASNIEKSARAKGVILTKTQV